MPPLVKKENSMREQAKVKSDESRNIQPDFSVHKKMNFGTANIYLTDEASKSIDGTRFIPAKNPVDALSMKSA